MTCISIFGAGGRMGQAIAEAAELRDDVRISGHHPDVFVDFSAPDAVAGHLAEARRAGKPILIGTTGLAPDDHRLIEEASAEIALVYASNTSLGVNLLAHLVRETAARLGEDWDLEIVEMHHRMKADAPSGTALALGEAAARGRGKPLKAERGRDGTGLKRGEGAIGFASLRGGTVPGDHDVVFAGADERVILSHRAENRMIFARGALAAARFLHGKPPGLYSMRDVIDSL